MEAGDGGPRLPNIRKPLPALRIGGGAKVWIAQERAEAEKGMMSAGADAPNLSIQMNPPFIPAYLCHPKDEPASTTTLAVTSLGRTLSLYSCDCSSKSSKHGKETTRTPLPSSRSTLAAFSAISTSDPEDKKMTRVCNLPGTEQLTREATETKKPIVPDGISTLCHRVYGCARELRQLLARQGKDRRPLAVLHSNFVSASSLIAISRPHHKNFFTTIHLSDYHEDNTSLRKSTDTDRIAHVVGEDEESGAVWNESRQVLLNAIADGSHGVLPHAEPQVPLCRGILLEVAVSLEQSHDARSAEPPIRPDLDEGIKHDLRKIPSGVASAVWGVGLQGGGGQKSNRKLKATVRPGRYASRTGRASAHPAGNSRLMSCLNSAASSAYFFSYSANFEFHSFSRAGPSSSLRRILTGGSNLLLTKRSTVSSIGVGLIGGTIANGGRNLQSNYLEHRGLVRHTLGLLNCCTQSVQVIVAILDVDGVPAKGVEASLHVLCECNVCVAINGDVVGNELSKAPMTGERGSLIGEALHVAAISKNAIPGARVMVDNLSIRLVEAGSKMLLSQSKSNGVGDALAKRTCKPTIGISREPASQSSQDGQESEIPTAGTASDPLPGTDRSTLMYVIICCIIRPRERARQKEDLHPVHPQGVSYLDAIVAVDVEQRVLEHAPVAGRENKAIPVEVVGVLGVESHVLIEQDVGHGRAAHGQARVAGLGLLHGVDGEEADGVDGELGDLGVGPGLGLHGRR
eukprot:SM000071S21097  [mRNA]  locus=s71:348042:352773:- [translate_table: standard]